MSFTDRRHIHPEFNIVAEADLGTSTGNVTMTLTGTFERPTIDLTSEVGARTPGEIAAEIVGSTNTETALTLLSWICLASPGARSVSMPSCGTGRFHRSRFSRLSGRPDAHW